MPARSKSMIPIFIGVAILGAAGLAWRFSGQPHNKYLVEGQAESHGEWFDAASLSSSSGGDIADAAASPHFPHAIRDPVKREEILRLLLAAQQEQNREAEEQTAPGTASASRGNRETNDLAELGRFIDEAIHDDFVPMAHECAKELASRQPDAGGTVRVTARLLGDPKIGGVVDTADIADERSTLHDDKFTECMRESMYGVYFDPPPSGAQVTLDFGVTVKGDGTGAIDEDIAKSDHIKDRRGETPPATSAPARSP